MLKQSQSSVSIFIIINILLLFLELLFLVKKVKSFGNNSNVSRTLERVLHLLGDGSSSPEMLGMETKLDGLGHVQQKD